MSSNKCNLQRDTSKLALNVVIKKITQKALYSFNMYYQMKQGIKTSFQVLSEKTRSDHERNNNPLYSVNLITADFVWVNDDENN